MAVDDLENHFIERGLPYERIWIQPLTPISIKNEWGKYEIKYDKKELNERIEETMNHLTGQKILTAMGHGMFHHYTSGILDILTDNLSQEYTYIHIDFHEDNQHIYNDLIDCGHFVHPNMAKNLKSILGISTRSKRWNSKVFDYAFQAGPTRKKYPLHALKQILNQIPTEDVYVSCDLDILRWFEMSTEQKWGNGDMSLSKLVEIIQTINDQKNIISADMVGYHVPFGVLSIVKDASLLVYETLYHAFNKNPTEHLIKEHRKLANRISWRA